MHVFRLARLLAITVIFGLCVPLLPAGRAAHAAPSPALHLSRSTAAPGDKIHITGTGYTPAKSVTVSINFVADGKSAPFHTTTPVSAAGTIDLSVSVPAKTAPGQYRVTTEGTQGATASQTLTVLPLAVLAMNTKEIPTIQVIAGHTFYVDASGFAAGETVTVSGSFPTYNGSTVTVSRTVKAGSNGTMYELPLTVPDRAKQGVVRLTAAGTTSKKHAFADVSVVYRPSLALTPNPIRPGAELSISGTGFVPKSQVSLSVPLTRTDGASVTLAKTVQGGDHGDFTTQVNLPSAVKTGSYTVTATDQFSEVHASAHLAITISPTLAAAPRTPGPGGAVTLTGSGFTANAQVQISATVPLYEGGTQALSQTATTNGQGAFTAQVRLPGHAAARAVQFSAVGPNGRAAATVTVHSIPTRIGVSPTPVRPGSSLTIHGSGYPAGDTATVSMRIRLTDGSSRLLSTKVTANGSGDFSASLTLPGNTRVGTYSLIAVSGATGRAPRAGVRVAVNAHISLQPGTIKPGQMVTVTGDGFSAHVSVTLKATIPLYGGGAKTVQTTATTNASGQFTARIHFPANAAAGSLRVIAQGPNSQTTAQLQVGRVTATIAVSPPAAIPGASVRVTGQGYPADDTVSVRAQVATSSGTQTLSQTAKTDAQGRFTASLRVPANATAGTFTVAARSETSGRVPTTRLKIVTVPTSLIAAPTTAAPGTAVTLNGFGFAAGESVTVTLNGQALGTATANSSGNFTTRVTVPAATASGSFTLAATGSAAHSAKATLVVNRRVATHFYFASLFTGKDRAVSLTFLNPTQIRARVQITYQLKGGGTKSKTVSVAAHARATENVNADLGANISASATVAADVPIAAERLMYVRHSGAVTPGARAPAQRWYFANGNTIGNYRVYIAVQNPNNASVQVNLRLLPTHSKPFTVTRTMPPNSRTTFKINNYVKHDAVGTLVTANMPIVANRTIFVHHGMTSKLGITQPQRTWYFAAGPRDSRAHHWIGVINPAGQSVQLTLHAYGPNGQELGSVHGTLRAGARAGYLMNKLAHQTDVSVVITTSLPIVAEQTTYVGSGHNASTDSMGVPGAAKSWAFAAVNTTAGSADGLDLFNPSLTPAPIVVQFMTASGTVVQRTYVVSPLAHRHVDVTSVMPNAQLGMVASSSQPFVAMNRLFFNNRAGSATSHGVQM